MVEEAESLALPDSVVQYFRGEIGQPPGGFPEPITSRVRKGRPMEDGSTHFSERPVRCPAPPLGPRPRGDHEGHVGGMRVTWW